MTAVGQSESLAELQETAILLFSKVADIIFPGKRVIVRDDVEPQSEVEETKEETSFKQTISQEYDNFIDALRNFEIVQEADIA